MNRVSLLLVFIPFIASCTDAAELFSCSELEDALGRYVDSVAPIQNPYDEDTMTTVLFSREGEDTVVFASTYFGGYQSPPAPVDSSYVPPEVKGAAYFHDRICIIVYNGFTHLTELINEKALTLPAQLYDGKMISARREKWYDGFIVLPRSFRRYVYRKEDGLSLTEYSIGATER